MMWKVVVAFIALVLAPAGLVLGPDPMRVAEVRSTYSAMTSAQQAIERDPSLIAQVLAHPWVEITLISKQAAQEEKEKRDSLYRQSQDSRPAQKMNALVAWNTLQKSPAPEYWDAPKLAEQAEIIHRRLGEVESKAKTRLVISHVLLVLGALAALWALVQRQQGTTTAGGAAIAGGLLPLLWLKSMDSMTSYYMIAFVISALVLVVSGLRTFVTPSHRAG